VLAEQQMMVEITSGGLDWLQEARKPQSAGEHFSGRGFGARVPIRFACD
jgi:hypothetical protein